MSGNVFIICVTVIVVSVIFAFCHWTEHQCDLSDDRYQYLCGQMSGLKKELDMNEADCQAAIDASSEIYSDFTKLKDQLISMLSDLVSALRPPEERSSMPEEIFTGDDWSLPSR